MAVDLAAALQGVVDALHDLELSADTDAGQVTPPGVVVQLVGLSPLTLDQRQVELRLLLVVPDSGGGQDAAAALSQLLATVESYATADGPITALPVVLPSDPSSPLPGLEFPLIITTQEG